MIEIKDLKKFYGQALTIDGVSLNVAKGEIFAIVGHSGAGKSTLLRCINGLESYQGGSLKVFGREISELKNDELRTFRRDVGMIFQHFALMSRKNVFENVAAPLKFWGFNNAHINSRVNELLNLVGLGDKAKSYPNALSGGQKQRVAVAVSMICGKDLLVFDEPTSGLDFDSMTQVAGLIRRLSNMGKVIFIVTHDFEFVCRTCSRVLHFDEGEMPDDVPVTMDALPKLRELFSVSDGKER